MFKSNLCNFYNISPFFPDFIVFFFLFTEITCTKESLNLTSSVNVSNGKSYKFQDEVTMSCNTGFSGKIVTTQCTGVNKWSQKTPTCTGKIFIFAIYKYVIVESRLSTYHDNQWNNLKLQEHDYHTV